MKPTPTWWRRRLHSFGRSLEVLSGLIGSSSFSGAQGNRLTMDWVRSATSPDKEAQGKLAVLRSRSRDLHRNNAYGAQFMRLMQDNVTGPRGIPLQSKAMTNRNEYDEATNRAVEAAWRSQGEPGACTVDGKLSWTALQRLLIGTIHQDGEVFLRLHRGTRYGEVPFALEVLDADLFDEEFNRVASARQNEIRQSVEIDERGRPIAYHAWRRHPNDINPAGGARNDRLRIPAAELLHLFFQVRPGQTRGYPTVSPVLYSLRMLGGYQEAEVVAARVAATKLGIITQSAESFAPPPGEAPNDIAPVVDAEPGSWIKLLPGEGIESFDPQHPSVQYRDFVKGVLQQVAAGLGVSYASLTSDLEGTSYASGRTGLLQERDHYRAQQMWLIEQCHRPIFTAWLDMARLTVLASLTDRKAADVLDALQWQPRGFAWVDPLKDGQATVLQIEHGLTSRTRVVAEQGEDIEDVLDEIAREEALAEAKDVSIMPAAPLAIPAAAPDAPADGASEDNAGDGAAAADEGRALTQALTLRLLQGGGAPAAPSVVVHPPNVQVAVAPAAQSAARDVVFQKDLRGEIVSARLVPQRVGERKVEFTTDARGAITGATIRELSHEEEVAV